MNDFIKDLREFVNMTYGKADMQIWLWALCKASPYCEERRQFKKAYESELDGFKEFVASEFLKFRAKFRAKYDQKTPSMIEWYRKGLGTLVMDGRFDVFINAEVCDAVKRAQPEKKAVFPWAVLGAAARLSTQECSLPEDRFRGPPLELESLCDIRDLVLPEFVYGLFQLKGVLEGQIKSVDSIKAKLLAGFVSVAVAGGQLAAKYIEHMLEDDGAH